MELGSVFVVLLGLTSCLGIDGLKVMSSKLSFVELTNVDLHQRGEEDGQNLDPYSGEVIIDTKELFPSQLNVRLLTEDGKPMSLSLSRRNNLNYESIKVETVGSQINEDKRSQSVAFYTDKENSAVLSARRSSEKSRDLSLTGTFMVEGKTYEITPADKTTRDAFERIQARSNSQTQLLAHTLKEVQLEKIKEKVLDDSEKDLVVEDEKEYQERSLLDQVMKGLLNKEDSTSKASVKRGVDPNQDEFYVEMTFICDFSIYSYWLNENGGDATKALEGLRFFFAHLFHGIFMAYEAIDYATHGIKIIPYLKKIEVITTLAADVYTVKSSANKIDINVVFSELKKRRVALTKSNYEDHSMLFSKIQTADNSIGVAYLSSVCSALGYSYVTDSGLHSWTVAAHELGHNLGSKHDGDGNSCSSSSYYLLKSSASSLMNSNYKNTFEFSSCSITQMKNHIMNNLYGYPAAACLYDVPCTGGEMIDDHLAELPGQEISLDEQCELATGVNGAKVAKCLPSYLNYYKTTVCKLFRCDLPGGSQNNVDLCITGSKNAHIRAAAGSPCDDSNANKVCFQGDCVDMNSISYSPAARGPCEDEVQTYSGTCNDTPGVKITYNTGDVYNCLKVAVADPRLCFIHSYVKSNCKRSCMDFGLYNDASPLCTLA